MFRGTAGLKDLLTDIQFLKRGEPPRHGGFQKAWVSVRKEVGDWLERQITDGAHGVVLAGHSLGGALATIGAIDLHKQYRIDAVVTFGAPRAGGVEFSQFPTRNTSAKLLGASSVVQTGSLGSCQDCLDTGILGTELLFPLGAS